MPLAKSEVDAQYDAKLGVLLRFKVTITAAGVSDSDLKYWTSVTGIKQNIALIKWNTSDGVDYTNQLPGLPEPGKVTLSRAITEQDTKATFKWLQEFQHKHHPKGTMHIKGHTAWGDPAGQWTFTGVWPITWTGPDFDTTKSSVATEKLDLIHDGLLQAAEGGASEG